jgi:hypothetical protein
VIAEHLARTKHTNGVTKKARAGQASIMFWGDPAVRRQLKMLSAETGKTQNRLLAEALNLMFREYNKPEIALE